MDIGPAIGSLPQTADHAPTTRPLGLRVPSLYAIAALGVLGAIFIIALAPRFDPDYWWHLKVGAYIASQHLVPSHDFFTYSVVGHPWTDHEWLSELMMYGLFQLGGHPAVLLVFAAIVAVTFALTYGSMVRLEVKRPLALGVLIVAAVASTGSWGPRVQMVTMLLTALFVLLLHRYFQDRDRRLLVAFPVVMLLWANLHGGFVVGLAVLAVALVGETLNARTAHPGALDRGDRRALAWTLLACLAVTPLNPNGIHQLLYPLTFLTPNAFTNLIQESASPNFHLVIMMAFEALFLLLLASLFSARRTVNWTHLALIVMFTHLAFSQSRNVPLWCVAISPLVALYLQQMLGWVHRPRHLSGGIKSVINVIFLALLLVAYGRATTYVTQAKTIQQFEARKFPVAAVAYLRTHHLPPHVFVSYTWGGYLLWNLFPHYRDFMDSRADTVFTAHMLAQYETMYAAGPGWQSALTRNRVDTVLVEPLAPLSQALAESSSWRLVFHTGGSVVYVRRSAETVSH